MIGRGRREAHNVYEDHQEAHERGAGRHPLRRWQLEAAANHVLLAFPRKL